jgi:serine/threonine protein kinase
VRGEPCDGRSDLFSLGSVLYAMCTGHEPFRAESVYGVLQRIVTDAPRPIREQNPAVPAWLERFVGKLMAKDRRDRFQSAAEVAELLERELAYLQSGSIAPAPSRPWMRRRMGRWWGAWSTRKRRAALIAATFLAITTTVALRPWRDATSDEREPAEPSTSESASVTISTSSLPRPTAPLWDDDGTADAIELGGALEASPYGVSAVAPPDPWPAAVDDLRQRMAELSEEFSPSTLPRSEP